MFKDNVKDCNTRSVLLILGRKRATPQHNRVDVHSFIYSSSVTGLSWSGPQRHLMFRLSIKSRKSLFFFPETYPLWPCLYLDTVLKKSAFSLLPIFKIPPPPPTHTDETQKLLKDLAHRKPLQVPDIFHHLPHLLNNEDGLHPAVQVGQGRTGGEHFAADTQHHSTITAKTISKMI